MRHRQDPVLAFFSCRPGKPVVPKKCQTKPDELVISHRSMRVFFLAFCVARWLRLLRTLKGGL
jgi:hypothetical protein